MTDIEIFREIHQILVEISQDHDLPEILWNKIKELENAAVVDSKKDF
jgi:hypothetical protein